MAQYTDNYKQTGEYPAEILWTGKINGERWCIRINVTVVETLTTSQPDV